jgi:hypothetical protein
MFKRLKGGLSSGGVGTWMIGKGGALEAMGSEIPGTDGIRGGRLRPNGVAWQEVHKLAKTTDQLKPGIVVRVNQLSKIEREKQLNGVELPKRVEWFKRAD